MSWTTHVDEFVYENGLAIDESIHKNVVKSIITKNKDKRSLPCLLVTGVPGSGKTTLAIHIAETIEGRKLDLELEDHPQIAMGGQELMEKALICYERKHKVIIYDEASDLNNKRQLSRLNNDLINFFAKARSLGLIIIICLQNVKHIDGTIFELGVIDGMLYCKEKHPTFTQVGIYDVPQIAYILHHAYKSGRMWWLPYKLVGPYAYGKFKALPPDRDLKLRTLTLMQKREDIKKRNDKRKKEEERIIAKIEKIEKNMPVPINL